MNTGSAIDKQKNIHLYFTSQLQIATRNLSELSSDEFINKIAAILNLMIESNKKGGKFVFFGNGGSAAEATHIAAEFIGKCIVDVGPVAAIALNDSSSILTALPNDFGFEHLFSRQITALCGSNDLVFGFSTSGNSQNVLNGLKAAKQIGASTVMFTGEKTNELPFIDIQVNAKTTITPRVQEVHLFVGHLLSELFALALKS